VSVRVGVEDAEDAVGTAERTPIGERRRLYWNSTKRSGGGCAARGVDGAGQRACRRTIAGAFRI